MCADRGRARGQATLVQDAFSHVMQQAASTHIGFINMPGANYRLLDDEDFYTGQCNINSQWTDEAVRYARVAMSACVLTPRPWAPSTRNDVAMVPQQLMWYGILIFNVPGLVAGLRRDTLLTSMLIGAALVGAAVIAPAGGNVGTLIRHRDMIVPFLAWLGALGGMTTIRSLHRLRTDS